MATEQPNEEEVFIGIHVICLMDLLAQKETLRKWAGALAQPLASEILGAIKKTAGTVEGFRENFANYFAATDESWHHTILANNLPPEKRDLFNRALLCVLEKQYFSDTSVFFSPIYDDFTLVPLHRMLVAYSWATTLSLAIGVPLRGAVCLGNGLQLKAGDFYGPGLAEAHELETNFVGHPRVILSTEVTRVLRSGTGFSRHPEIETVMQGVRQMCGRLVCTDLDGQSIVDYLGEGVHELVRDDQDGLRVYANAVEKAYRFVASAQSRFAEERNIKLHQRYSLVRHYMDSRLQIWGLQGLSQQMA